jgi:hypothetical protein
MNAVPHTAARTLQNESTKDKFHNQILTFSNPTPKFLSLHKIIKIIDIVINIRVEYLLRYLEFIDIKYPPKKNGKHH